jgi:hypothetical protein
MKVDITEDKHGKWWFSTFDSLYGPYDTEVLAMKGIYFWRLEFKQQ